MRFIVDPRVRFNYATYYIYGMRKVYGRASVSFDVSPFLNIHYDDFMQYISGMPIIAIADDNTTRRIFIDYGDYDTIYQDRYDWAEVYAKVNVTEEQLQQCDKMMAIGPGFGIKIEAPFAALWKGICNCYKSRRHTAIPMWRMMGDYAYSFVRRLELDCYQPKADMSVQEGYVFHASTLWCKPYMDKTTNAARGAFLRICKELGLKVEGGLYYIGGLQDDAMPDYTKYLEKYKEWILRKRISARKYVDGTRSSVCVFNTPTVGMCHGWKLAEYLCMGKAIISTPLTRMMPGEGLVHGRNIHIVNNPQELREAVCKLREDRNYRRQLEQGARAYYEQYLAPEEVINRSLSPALHI